MKEKKKKKLFTGEFLKEFDLTFGNSNHYREGEGYCPFVLSINNGKKRRERGREKGKEGSKEKERGKE